MESMQAFPLVMNFLMMPMFFLSGALYPLGNLPAPLAFVTRLDPLSYGVDGLRGALAGTSHFAFALDAGVLAAVAALFLALGAWSFSRIQL
jgi:ABC-2 type transport system permease protein